MPIEPTPTDLIKAKDAGLKTLRFYLNSLNIPVIPDNIVRVIYEQGFIDGTNIVVNDMAKLLDYVETKV